MLSQDEQQQEIVFELLCCVMVADGKAARDEKGHLIELMGEYGCAWTPDEIGVRVGKFVSRVRAEGIHKVLDKACRNAERLDDDHAGQLIEKCHRLARADDDYKAREWDVVQKIEIKLNQLPFIRRALQTPVKSDYQAGQSAPARKAGHLPMPFVWGVLGVIAVGFGILVGSLVGISELESAVRVVVWLVSALGSQKLFRRLVKWREERLQVLLNAPRNGLVIADGYISPRAGEELIQCMWSDRECVAYTFCLDEVYEGGKNDEGQTVERRREAFRDSKSVPFVIQSEYGDATINTDLVPVKSEFQSDWEHHDAPGRFRAIFRSLSGRHTSTLLKKQGRLTQRYCDLLEGQHISILGTMTVQLNGEGHEKGHFLNGGRFSTQPKPDFPRTPIWLKLLSAILLAMHVLVPFWYLTWSARH